jgi:hypothetical protein
MKNCRAALAAREKLLAKSRKFFPGIFSPLKVGSEIFSHEKLLLLGVAASGGFVA